MKKVILGLTLFLVFSFSTSLAMPPIQTEDGQEYTVQANDWLSKLALKYYGDIFAYTQIVEATNAKAQTDDSFTIIDNPDLIEVGQKLWIPNTTGSLNMTNMESDNTATETNSMSSESSGNLDNLLAWMTGYFNSQEQAASDEDFFDVRLRMAQIWDDNPDGYWIYVEQAIAESEDTPYRQRIYHLTEPSPGVFESAVYELPDPDSYIGQWQNPDSFDALSVDSLSPRTGCSITMTYQEGAYVGGTNEKDCPSSLRGASYATSEVSITAEGMVTWDKGFDNTDNQVWGSEKGGYIFKRVAAN